MSAPPISEDGDGNGLLIIGNACRPARFLIAETAYWGATRSGDFRPIDEAS
jgi:hypothetical protein